jgi:hypothetical protein
MLNGSKGDIEAQRATDVAVVALPEERYAVAEISAAQQWFESGAFRRPP